MSERKDFEKWQVEIVYNKQEGLCGNEKCTNTLAYGLVRKYDKHHKDGDPLNTTITNLVLLCPRCHGGEQFKTLMKKKEDFLNRTLTILDMSQEGKISGALAGKIEDLMKLGLSLSSQVYGYEIEKAPASIRIKNQLLASGLLLRKYEEGYVEGMNKGAAMNVSTVLPSLLENIKLKGDVKKLSKIIQIQSQLQGAKKSGKKGNGKLNTT